MDPDEAKKIDKQIRKDKNIFSIVKANKASVENLKDKEVNGKPYFEWEVDEVLRFLNDGDSLSDIKKKISKKRAYYKKREVNIAKAKDVKVKKKEPPIAEQKKAVLKRNVQLQGFNVKNFTVIKEKDKKIRQKALYDRLDTQAKTVKDLVNPEFIKILGKPELVIGEESETPTFLTNFIVPYPKYDKTGAFVAKQKKVIITTKFTNRSGQGPRIQQKESIEQPHKQRNHFMSRGGGQPMGEANSFPFDPKDGVPDIEVKEYFTNKLGYGTPRNIDVHSRQKRPGKLSSKTKFNGNYVYMDKDTIKNIKTEMRIYDDTEIRSLQQIRSDSHLYDTYESVYGILQLLVAGDFSQEVVADWRWHNESFVPEFFKDYLGEFDNWDKEAEGENITFKQMKQYYELSMYVIQKIRNKRQFKARRQERTIGVSLDEFGIPAEIIETEFSNFKQPEDILEVYSLNRFKVQYDFQQTKNYDRYCNVFSKYREPEEILEDEFHTWTIGGSESPLGGFRTFSPTMVIKWGTKTYRPMRGGKLIEHSGKASNINLKALPKYGSLLNAKTNLNFMGIRYVSTNQDKFKEHSVTGRYATMYNNEKSDYNYMRRIRTNPNEREKLIKNLPQYVFNGNAPHSTILENKGTINKDVYERIRDTYKFEQSLYPFNNPTINKIAAGQVYYGAPIKQKFNFKQDIPVTYPEWFEKVYGEVAIYDDEKDDSDEEDRTGVRRGRDRRGRGLVESDEEAEQQVIEEVEEPVSPEFEQLVDEEVEFVHWLFKLTLTLKDNELFTEEGVKIGLAKDIYKTTLYEEDIDFSEEFLWIEKNWRNQVVSKELNLIKFVVKISDFRKNFDYELWLKTAYKKFKDELGYKGDLTYANVFGIARGFGEPLRFFDTDDYKNYYQIKFPFYLTKDFLLEVVKKGRDPSFTDLQLEDLLEE